MRAFFGRLRAMEEDIVSKSARKRQALKLQDLGRALTGLKRAQLEALSLPDRLAQAIFDYQRFPSHEARRRQLQYIGRLMRDLEIDEIEAGLASLHGESAAARYRLHLAEQWRDRLLAEPAALTAFLDAFPDTDRQALRQALQRVHSAGADAPQKAALRALFRLIRAQIPESADAAAVPGPAD
jgi:ribosome-associated protein